MPNFTADSWSIFKQQFLSVIKFIFYAFDILWDSFCTHPMLYTFLLFPVFAVAFFIVFDFFTHLVSNGGITSNSSKANGLNSLSLKNYGYKSDHNSFKSAFSHEKAMAKVNSDLKIHSNMLKAVSGNDYKASVGSELRKSIGKSSVNSDLGKSIGMTSVNSDLGKSIGNVVVTAKKSHDRKIREEVKEQERQRKEQEKHDKDFNTATDIYHSKDEKGNPVTTRIKTNTSTGEITGRHITVNHIDE